MLNRLCSAAEFDPRWRLLGSIFTGRAREGEGGGGGVVAVHANGQSRSHIYTH